jgi:hypothetical protein
VDVGRRLERKYLERAQDSLELSAQPRRPPLLRSETELCRYDDARIDLSLTDFPDLPAHLSTGIPHEI